MELLVTDLSTTYDMSVNMAEGQSVIGLRNFWKVATVRYLRESTIQASTCTTENINLTYLISSEY